MARSPRASSPRGSSITRQHLRLVFTPDAGARSRQPRISQRSVTAGRWTGVSCRLSVPCRTGCPYSHLPPQMQSAKLIPQLTRDKIASHPIFSLVSAPACALAEPGLALLPAPLWDLEFVDFLAASLAALAAAPILFFRTPQG